MSTRRTEKIIGEIAEELKFPKEVVLEESLSAFLEKKLREVRARIFQISGKYGVSSVREMEERYKQGTLKEEGTWQDFQRLDHLEYKRDRLIQLLKELE